MEHIITGVLANKPGVLGRLVQRFGALNVNIDSLNVGPGEVPDMARVTIVANTEQWDSKQLADELSGVVEVSEIDELGLGDHYERELALVQVHNDPAAIGLIMQTAEVFDATMVGVDGQTLTLEIAGEPDRINGFLQMLRSFGVLRVARTGRTAIRKGTE